MYMAGMGNAMDDYEAEDQTQGQIIRDAGIPWPTGGNAPASFPTVDFNSQDWTGVVSNALKTWGTVRGQELQTQAQVDIARANASRYPYGMPGVLPAGATGLYPYPGASGTLAGIPVNWIIIGGAAIAAIILMSGKSRRR